MRRLVRVVLALCMMLTITSCAGSSGRVDLRIVSGSENDTLEPLIKQFARKGGYNIEVTYQGSVDMMLGLEEAQFPYDAVWPAHSLWITLGDEQLKRVKYAESIMRSPVVLGIRKSLATQLGFVGRDVTVSEILAATESGKLRFMMTNASQSNSGAIAYLGFIYSFLGGPEVISSADLDRPELATKITKLLSAVNRSSGSSGWLKDLYLQSDTQYDGMINYESVIIETNQELAKRGHEPLYAVYPVDGQAIADSPLGYVDKGDKKKEKIFQELQAYLLSTDVQKELLKRGRRAALLGLDPTAADKAVFNPDWGVDTERVINQIRFPQPAVIRKALSLYQTSFRKPSFTIFALDYSGSMAGKGVSAVKDAMGLLLQQDSARRWMIQSGSEDITIVIPFNGKTLATWIVRGNQQGDLDGLLRSIQSQRTDDGTDIYLPVINGLQQMIQRQDILDKYQPAIILMTDGKSNSEENWPELQKEWKAMGRDVPVFAILFGDADKSQLEQITSLTHGRVFDGTRDLVQAFRTAKGYN
jgi:Ca-activated chloride channel homolog